VESEPDAPRRLRRAEAILASRMSRLAVVVEDVRDPHNIDAVVRTAESFGVQNLYRVETDTRESIAASVTQGAHRWLTQHRFERADTCLAGLRDDGYTVWAADVAPGAMPLDELELPPRLAVAVGSELEGLSEPMRAGADARFFLPMQGFTGSLNVSVTAAIVIWELVRRMVERDGQRGDLDDDEKAALRQLWYQRLARTEAQKRLFPQFVDSPPDPLYDRQPPPERRTLEASKKR